MTAALALALVQPCAAVTPNPTPIDLGVLPGCTSSEVYDINAAGQAVGVGFPLFLPFIWEAGVMSQLPLPEGCTQAAAIAINASGSIVGMCIKDTKNLACVWTPRGKSWAATALPAPTFTYQVPGEPDLVFTFSDYIALQINRAGQVLVYAMLVAETGGTWAAPLIWHNGNWSFLTNEAGEPVGADDPRMKLNENGQVLFWRGDEDAQSWNEVWLWDGNVARRLVADVNWVQFNNAGQVVGVRYHSVRVNNEEVGWSENFTYDAATKVLTTSPWTDAGYYLADVNDSGQVAVVIPTVDVNGYVTPPMKLGLTTFAGWSPAAVVTELGTVDTRVEMSSLNLNAAGEISGDGYATGTAFFASAAAGVVILGDRVTAMNDSGDVVGSIGERAMLWCAGLAVGEVKVARKGSTVTVTVSLINTSGSQSAENIEVTSASLDGGSLAAPLPSIRSLAPGAKRSVTVKFTSDTQPGDQTFAVAGTSSVGAFSATMTLTVP